MGHESNYITASPRARLPDVRFAGTFEALLPAVCRGYPMPFRCGVFALSADKSQTSKRDEPRPVTTSLDQHNKQGLNPIQDGYERKSP